MSRLKSSLLQFCLFSFLLSFGVSTSAQEDDLLSQLDDEEEVLRTIASFKTTRIVNSHSLETTLKGVLDLRISHRFGAINGGFYEMFGLDQATMRMGLDYGITERLSVGFGRSTYEKSLDGFLKYRLLWQTENSASMPISLVLVSGLSSDMLRYPAIGYDMTFERRLNYYHQMLIGRKFSPSFSLQLMPTLVHRNLVQTQAEQNTIFAMGAAQRLKLMKRVSLNAEYYFLPENQVATDVVNSFSIGFDIETGGHVFQLFFSNSLGFIEKAYIADTRGDYLTGDFFFGFTISRVFDVGR
jgi:hypothetical protein